MLSEVVCGSLEYMIEQGLLCVDHALKCDTHDCACSFCEEAVESSVYNSQAWRMVIDTTSMYTCVPSAWCLVDSSSLTKIPLRPWKAELALKVRH